MYPWFDTLSAQTFACILTGYTLWHRSPGREDQEHVVGRTGCQDGQPLSVYGNSSWLLVASRGAALPNSQSVSLLHRKPVWPLFGRRQVGSLVKELVCYLDSLKSGILAVSYHTLIRYINIFF